MVDACEQLLGAVGPVLQQVDPRRLPDEQGGTSDVMPRLQAARRAFVEAAGRSGMGSVEAGLVRTAASRLHGVFCSTTLCTVSYFCLVCGLW